MITVERTKSFDTCSRIAMSSHTSLPAPLQKLPLVSSKETCSQKIEAGIMKQVDCNQHLLLRPITGAGGVVTTVKTSLILTGSSYGVSVPGMN